MECKLNSKIVTYMVYNNPILILTVDGKIRTYSNVPTQTAYGLAYSKTPTKTYNQSIKGKFNVINVI